MTDTVTRLMGLADDYAVKRMLNPNKLLFGKAKDARQALQDELTRLLTPSAMPTVQHLPADDTEGGAL